MGQVPQLEPVFISLPSLILFSASPHTSLTILQGSHNFWCPPMFILPLLFLMCTFSLGDPILPFYTSDSKICLHLGTSTRSSCRKWCCSQFRFPEICTRSKSRRLVIEWKLMEQGLISDKAQSKTKIKSRFDFSARTLDRTSFLRYKVLMSPFLMFLFPYFIVRSEY